MRIPKIVIVNQNSINVKIDVSVTQVIEIIGEMDIADKEKEVAVQKLRELEGELAKPKPEWKVIKSCLAWALGFSEKVFLQLLPLILKGYGHSS